MNTPQSLNLPPATLKTRQEHGRTQVFDPFRRRYVALTPEEFVRQHFLQYLVMEKGVPASLIRVESSLMYHRRSKRSDIVVCSATGQPVLIVECKSPEVAITQAVFDQVAMYNMTLQVDFLVVTNGIQHFCCFIDHEKRSYAFLQEIPQYREMTGEVVMSETELGNHQKQG